MNPYLLQPARNSFSRTSVRLAPLALAWFLVLSGGHSQAGASPLADAHGTSPSCEEQGTPPGWPDFSQEGQALLEPFLACSSPAAFLALQQRVDMPRMVARLDNWAAVRLGALGPVREDAAGVLNGKRAAFLLQSLERYGPTNTEVLAHFVLDSSPDDDLRDILSLLARDKRLRELLELLPSLGPALEARQLSPSARVERDFQWRDLGRGLARAGRDAVSTSPLVDGAQSRLMELASLRAQLPPPYQQALDEVEREQLAGRFSTGSLVVGLLDHLTFGVPLGFYGLAAGTGQGVYALSRGHYEQAVRELAPAALLVALYAGGKGARALSTDSRVWALREQVRRLEASLGVEGLREVAREIRAIREAGRFVAVGGADAALFLHEARGNVARAQAMMSKVSPEAAGSSTAGRGPVERLEGMSAWTDPEAGLTRQVIEMKLEAAELESTNPRLPTDVALLEKQRPLLDAPPVGRHDNPRWSEYVAYYERRLGELREGKAAKAPLRWDAYETLWKGFSRGLDFERLMVKLLRADAKLPRAQRRFLGDFDRPRIETYVGVRKPATGLRYADVLVIEEGEVVRTPRRVETFSFKSRNLSMLEREALEAQMFEDATEALHKYGETLDVRRDSLWPLLGEEREVPVLRVCLIYEGGDLVRGSKNLTKAMIGTEAEVPGVEVYVQ